MRHIFLIITCLTICCKTFAQSANPLLLFLVDSTKLIGGIKKSTGRIIIPAKYYTLANQDTIDEFCKYIYLKDTINSNKPFAVVDDRYKTFDIKGNYLYNVFWFDHGPDYFAEGLVRIVENEKMGFANLESKIVIPAKYNYVEPFSGGVTLASKNCETVIIDAEHSTINCKNYFILDLAGKELKTYTAKNYTEAFKIFSKFKEVYQKKLLPTTSFEKNMVAQLKKNANLKRTFEAEGNLQAIIINKSTKGTQANYFISFENSGHAITEAQFIYIPASKHNYNQATYLHLDACGTWQTLEQWKKDYEGFDTETPSTK